MNKFRCIAILRDIQPEYCCEITNALIEEGITELEISLSNDEIGYATIEKILNEFHDKVRIGAGTVTKIQQVEQLKKLGSDFLITPAFNEDIVKKAKELDIEIIPGVFTPQDVMNALELGIFDLKLFPFDAFPINYMKSLKGPFPKANFFAVGGVNLDNIEKLYDVGFIGIAPGSDLVKRGATLDDIPMIRLKAKQYMEEMNRVCNRTNQK